MAILTPTSGDVVEHVNWGPTTKIHFNEFEATANFPVCMASIHTSVLDSLIEWAIERPEYDPSDAAVGTASVSSTDSVILVDSYGKATRAVAGTHYISPNSTAVLAAEQSIYLGSSGNSSAEPPVPPTGYIDGNGDAKFRVANVGTLNVDSLQQVDANGAYTTYKPFILGQGSPQNLQDLTRLYIDTSAGIIYYPSQGSEPNTVIWTALGAVFK